MSLLWPFAVSFVCFLSGFAVVVSDTTELPPTTTFICLNGGSYHEYDNGTYGCNCTDMFYGMQCQYVKCGGQFYVGDNITSPFYPDTYGVHPYYCRYLLRDKSGQSVKDEILSYNISLVVDMLQLVNSDSCANDYIEVFVNPAHSLGRYCSESHIPGAFSFPVGSAPYMTFITNSDKSDKGFVMRLVDGVGCAALQCYNEGNCTATPNGAKCECPVTFKGPRCQSEVCGGDFKATSIPQPLSFHDCSQSCTWQLTAKTQGSLVKVDFSEILSDDCATPHITITDVATGNPISITECTNNATATSERRVLQIQLTNSTSSKCGFKATFYEVEVDNCKGQACENGGTCVNQDYNYYCKCPDGYQGPRCETESHPCQFAQYVCKNGGKCTEDVGAKYHCDCTGTGYTGDICEIYIPGCLGVVCYNGGTCIPTPPKRLVMNKLLSGEHCTCSPPWRGPLCQDHGDDICDTVPPEMCGHGHCVNDSNIDYHCQCDAGYTGQYCIDDINATTESTTTSNEVVTKKHFN